MAEHVLLSVVTVTYNDAAALRATLTSCRSQKDAKSDCEFIVIDGASTDGTADVVSEFRDVTSVYVSEPDRGIYDAMNKGLRRARGRYVMYLNAGDEWYDDTALQAVCEQLRTCMPAWLIGGALSLEGGQRRRVVKNIPHSWSRHALGLQAHCHQSTIIARNLISDIGGFSEDYSFAGDFDLIFRVGLIARPDYLDRLVVTYAGGGVSAVNAHRISELQRRVRSDRMQLGPAAEILNGAFMRYHRLRRSAIPFVTILRQLRGKIGDTGRAWPAVNE